MINTILQSVVLGMNALAGIVPPIPKPEAAPPTPNPARVPLPTPGIVLRTGLLAMAGLEAGNMV